MAENKEVLKRFKRLRNLPQYKSKTDEELMVLAEEQVRNELFDTSKDSWLPGEATRAKELYDKYIEGYNLTSPSDMEGLNMLVFNEILVQRLQRLITKTSMDKDGNFTAPSKGLMEAIQNANEQVIEWKERLGLFKNKQENDGFNVLQTLKKKVLAWFHTNPNIPYLTCPYCQGDLYIKLREPQLYEAVKHPLFRDKILWNDALLEYVHDGKLTAEEGARILETSEEMINRMVAKKYNKQAPAEEKSETPTEPTDKNA